MLLRHRLLATILLCASQISSTLSFVGPQFPPTKGEPWPLPQQREIYDGYVVVRPEDFHFEVTKEDCDIMQDAIKRYYDIIVGPDSSESVKTKPNKRRMASLLDETYLDSLEIQLTSACEEYPYLHMDESYTLDIFSSDLPNAALLTSESIWGILRGLETFTQLIYRSEDRSELWVNKTAIVDSPRFSHRGLMLDTARHYLPLNIVFRQLDAMSYNKLNVLHWHIVDDQSFPYQSEVFPDLSAKGAYIPEFIYTQDDVKQVIEYARLRGIRVIPEFDSPGHTNSWGQGQADLLTPCYNDEQEPDGTYGPINPMNDANYDFINTLFAEVNDLFPDKYMHLGGDEVSFNCWATNPDINSFMDTLNITGDYKKLEEYYIQKVVDLVTAQNASSVVWQEVFDNGVQIPLDTVVHIWTGDQEEELSNVTSSGYPALLSACWYLDHLLTGGDWTKFYNCEPTLFDGTDEQKALIVGGEACMWAEVVDDTNIESRIWPRASATAEILWSPLNASTVAESRNRIEEHACRMKLRGIHAQPPNGPGFCY